MRAAWTATVALVGCCALSRPACFACDTDAIRARVQSGGDDVAAIDARDGIVTFVLRARPGAGSIALAVHASGTRLSTSAMGGDANEDAMARIDALAARWNADPDMQGLLRDCGAGFSDTADPTPV